MPNPPFDVWAPTEIVRLREQADALERALKLYLSNFEVQPQLAANAAPAPSVVRSVERSAERGTRGVRPSKYDEVIQAFVDEGRPLSHQEMSEIAEILETPIESARLRSLIFAQKKLGNAREVGGKYEWGAPKEATTTQEGSTPSEEGVDNFI
jgi:hypothetical protein